MRNHDDAADRCLAMKWCAGEASSAGTCSHLVPHGSALDHGASSSLTRTQRQIAAPRAELRGPVLEVAVLGRLSLMPSPSGREGHVKLRPGAANAICRLWHRPTSLRAWYEAVAPAAAGYRVDSAFTAPGRRVGAWHRTVSTGENRAAMRSCPGRGRSGSASCHRLARGKRGAHVGKRCERVTIS